MAAAVFQPELVTFLRELEANNNRDWFAENKPRYEEQVLEPALAFISIMADRLPAFAPQFTAVPKRQGGSLMRIYRDMRFSRNKKPYKTNVGIQFRHKTGRDVHAPGYYFHIDPNSVFLGAGLWRPQREALAGIRDRIVAHPRQWRNAISDTSFKRYFDMTGDSLQRPPRGYDADHPLIDEIKRKDFIAVCHLTHADLFKKSLIGKIEKRYQAATPLMKFLCRGTGVAF